jgi:Tfp pilus assembly protein PilN
MNAVNLIPADARRRGPTVSASPLTMGIIGGLVVVLAAAVLYVSALNDVTARKSELARVTASVSSWQSAANSFTTFEETAQQRQATLDSVKQLAVGRFAWETLLSQIGGVMPPKAALSSLQATTAASAATASTSSTTPASGTSATAGSAAAPVLPSVQLSGCANSQSTVAQTMVALRRVTGVSDVSLSSATDTGAATSGTGGGCPFRVTFQVSLTFSAPAASTVSSGAAGTSVPAGTGGTTTSPAAATPTASAATTSTGAAQ